jgi:hypothetical protein
VSEISSEPTFRPLLAPVSREGDGDLDAVAFASEEHVLVYVTGLVGNRREVVGLEIHPLPMEHDPDEGPLLEALMINALDTFGSYAPGSLAPIGANLLRRIPLLPVLTFRQDMVAKRRLVAADLSADRQAELGRIASIELSARDATLLGYLDEALLYLNALEERASPASLVAQARGVTERSAANRIAKARAMGLLTPAEKRMAAGGLTDDAVRLDTWRRGALARIERTR